MSKRAPKRAGAKPRAAVGLLGAPLQRDSDDSDYEPEAPRQRQDAAAAATPPAYSRGARKPGRGRAEVARGAPAGARGRGARGHGARGAAAPAGPGGGGGSDSDAETLTQRRARILREQAAAAAAAGPHGGSGAGGGAGRAVDALPLNVLSHVFQLACAAGALPTACRLARVCRAWREAVASTPEVWRVVDARGRQSKKVDAWLQAQAKSGRWAKLEHLTIGQASGVIPGATGAGELGDYGDAAQGASRDPGTSAEALAAIAAHCPCVRSLTVEGSPAIRAPALEAAVMSMTSLEELRLHEVRLQPLTGLDRLVQALLAAAWGGGRPLRALEARGCQTLGNKTLRMLAQGPADHAAPNPANHAPATEAPAGADGAAAAAPAAPAAAASSSAAAGAGAPAAGAPPAAARGGYPDLIELDLTGSCMTPGVVISVESLQAACPGLRSLSLDGVGGIYGWGAPRPRAGAAPAAGWRGLRSLLLGAPERPRGAASGSLDDGLLMRLAAGATGLQVLGLRGSSVTPAGLRAALLPAVDGGGGGGGGGGGSSGRGEPPPAEPGAGGLPAGTLAGADARAGAPCADEIALPISHLEVSQSALCCDEGLAVVGALLSKSLRDLHACGAGGHLTDAGLECLHGCAALRRLGVGGAGVTDQGLQALLESPAGRSLEWLDASRCRALSRAARQAAGRGVGSLRRHLQQAG